ncbi:MAG: DUF983 domain-containing protein [Alphaproteobacteria bacterium]|nr:DUF983 domain-containing protein [Alphaproteobacteria bacterium]
MLRGLLQRCPACGQGSLYNQYLKVRNDCDACGLGLHQHRADDAPPYFTMLILGHVLVPLALMLERAAMPPLWLHLALWLPLTIILTLVLLPRIKGALIGFQWAHGMHGFGGETE